MTKHSLDRRGNIISFDDLTTSAQTLGETVGAQKEKDRILKVIKKEERETENNYISYDRLKLLIG